MDRTTALEKQFSLSATNIAIPIAESTSLNINGRNSPTQFHWGGSMTSKINGNKSIDVVSNRSGSNHNNLSAGPNEQRSIGSRFNTTRIDPRIYADVQSKGLASRIVKYHEKGNRFNRSLSVNNHYSKPGQFPIVHLKKTEIPHRQIKQNVSMTRIAPPEKSVFYGNTLPSILRSNSAGATLQKNDEQLSSENRPILHPPQTKNELVPTRSVIEVLKEISRKRINSEHSNQNDDKMKKYCSRTVDDVSNATSSLPRNKRQRVHLYSQQQLTKNLSSQHSPEQMPKKRLCSYNNDISSSLSSSQIHANKRKVYECKPNNESASQAASAEQNGQATKIKQLVPQYDLRDEHFLPLANSKACGHSTSSNATQNEDDSRRKEATRTTHMVDGPLSQCGLTKSTRTVQNAHANVFPINKQKLTLFNKNYNECKDNFEAEQAKDSKATTDNGEFSAIPFVKPKKDISISGAKNPIIERIQKSKLALMLSGLRGDLYNDEDQLEKKILSSEKYTISALSAEERSDSIAPGVTTTTSVSSTSPTFNSNIVSEAESINTGTKVNDVPVAVTRALVANEASPLVGIKLTPQAAVSSTLIKFASNSKNATNVESSSATSASSSSLTTITATASNSATFSSLIGTTTASAAIGLAGTTSFDSSLSSPFKGPSLIAFGNTNSVGPAAFKFGAVTTNENTLDSSKASTPFAFVTSSLVSSNGVKAKTSEPNTNESNSNSSKSPDTANITKPFNFGISSTNSSVSSAPSTINGFNFGIQSTSEKPFAAAAPFSVQPTPQSTTQPINNFTFGGTSASTSSTAISSSGSSTTAAPSIATSTATKFTFGDVSSQTKSFNGNVANQTPASFGFGTNFSSTKPQTAVDGPSKKGTNISAPFSFNTTTTQASSVSKSAGFSFGSSSLSSTESNQKTTNIFRTSLPKSNVKPTFSFGGATSSPATAPSNPCFESPPLNVTASIPVPSSNGITFGAVAPTSAGNPQSKTFTFGSLNNSAAPENSLKSNSGGFFFNPDNKINAGASTFGSSANPANTASTNSSSPFTFGSSIPNDASTNSGKQFPLSAPATNPFGASAVSKTSTFNFGGSSNSTAPAAPAATANIFVPPQQNSNSGMADRPFRRATRRLQKP